MNIYGWCLGCHHVKGLSEGDPLQAGGVTTGLCASCVQRRDSQHHTLTVYVPVGLTTMLLGSIRPGSAIVGGVEGERILVDYEGDKYGRGDGYEDWLKIAAGRHIDRYPTVARMSVPPASVHAVGTYEIDGLWHTLLKVTDQAALDGWLNT